MNKLTEQWARITTEYTMRDGSMIDVYVRQNADGVWEATDRGSLLQQLLSWGYGGYCELARKAVTSHRRAGDAQIINGEIRAMSHVKDIAIRRVVVATIRAEIIQLLVEGKI